MSAIIGNQAFPAFSMFHAHCAMSVKFDTASCLQSFNLMKDAVQTWHPEPKAGGTYKVWEATEEESMWVTRTTPAKHYVDDIMFEYFGNPDDFQAAGCTVKAKS